MSYAFGERVDGGTHFEVRFAKPKPKDLPFYEHIWPKAQNKFTREFVILRAFEENQMIITAAQEGDSTHNIDDLEESGPPRKPNSPMPSAQRTCERWRARSEPTTIRPSSTERQEDRGAPAGAS
jgi:hypothetical protein